MINNGLGSVGVAPVVRVASTRAYIQTGPESDDTLGTPLGMAAAIYWAQDIGAKITSHSYGSSNPSAGI